MKDLCDTTCDGTFSGMDDSCELDSLKRVKDKENNKSCEETKLEIINKNLNLTSMHGDIYSQINSIIYMNEDSNNNDNHKIINFESYRKREKKELEKLDLNEKKIIHVKSQTNYENNSGKQKLKSLIDAKSGSVLWEIHLEDIEAMIQLGERQSITYPPWIQFRYDKCDPILKDLYDKIMKRCSENFGFGIKLIPIKSKEIESYIISEVLHQNTINENEDINSRRSLLNPNVDLTEVFDSLKKHSIKNLKSKNPLPVNVLKDLSSALKLDLQKHYEDWLAYILSIFNGEEVFTLDNLQTIYQYFDNTQRKHSIEKKSSKVCTIKGPFVYLYQIKRHSKLCCVKENKNLQRLFSTILKIYNEELVNAIKQMKLIMINIACNEGYDLEKMEEDLNRLVVKKLKENEDPYAIFLNLEKRRDCNYDDREEIVYNQMLDYTISKGSVVETHFPNIKEHKVIISEELEKRVKNELLDKHFKCINSFEKEESYGEKHSDQIDRKKLKSDLFDFSQMRMDSYVEAELDKKRRKVKAKDFEIKENDIVSYSNNCIAEVERFKNNSNKFLECCKSIKMFSWAELAEWTNDIEEHIEDKNELPVLMLKDYPFEYTSNQSKCIDQICEFHFNSFPKKLEFKPKSKEEKKKLLNWIIRRNKTIKSIGSCLSSYQKNEKYTRSKGLEFIITEMECNEQSSTQRNQIGEQRGYFFSQDTIVNYPYECIMRLNSTKGRLHVLYNWEDIANHFNFINQIEYSNVFGFRYPSNGSNTINVFPSVDCISRCSQETKLELIYKIRKLILLYVREIKPYILFRYLAEQKLNERIREYDTVRNPTNYHEESCYFLICSLMYIYSAMKNPKFDIDRNMRGLLICKRHSTKNAKGLKTTGCSCLYFMQTKCILESLKSSDYRTHEISAHLAKYFIQNNKDKIFTLRSSFKKTFIEYFNGFLYDNKMIEVLEERFKLDLNDLIGNHDE